MTAPGCPIAKVPTGTPAGNLAKGIPACRRAAELGADIALFPEMWSNGYALHGRPVEDWTAEAVDVDGDFVSAFGELARELSEFARQHIAHYKVPRSIDFRDELPRLPTGKLYKRLLRDEYWGDKTSRIV